MPPLGEFYGLKIFEISSLVTHETSMPPYLNANGFTTIIMELCEALTCPLSSLDQATHLFE